MHHSLATQALINGVRSGEDVDLNSIKMQAASKYSLSRAPKLVEIIGAVPEEMRAVLLPQLKAKPIRTASGIAVVAVMSKPHRCPHIATTGEQREENDQHACENRGKVHGATTVHLSLDRQYLRVLPWRSRFRL